MISLFKTLLISALLMERMDNHDRRRSRTVSPIIMSLLYQLYQQLQQSDYNPPITILLLGMNILVHLHPYPKAFGFLLSDIRSNCIHPLRILHSWQYNRVIPWNRLFLSSLIHVDDIHLYYNMLSLCWKGINLERSLGSFRFLQLVIFSLVVSHSLMVVLSYLLFSLAGLDDQLSGFNTCAVGFSAVLFSLKYVWNSSCDNYSNVMGIHVPTKYAAWVELVVISMVTPNASFLGHLCGICAGVLYVHGILHIMLIIPRWIVDTFRKLFTSGSVVVEDDIELEDVNDLHSTDPFNVQFAERDELRQKRLRKFNGKSR